MKMKWDKITKLLGDKKGFCSPCNGFCHQSEKSRENGEGQYFASCIMIFAHFSIFQRSKNIVKLKQSNVELAIDVSAKKSGSSVYF